MNSLLHRIFARRAAWFLGVIAWVVTHPPGLQAAEANAAFALIGTASHPGGAIAFFDGNRAEYQGSLHVGEKLGEWTLAAIEHDRVRLKSADGEVELPMQKQLRRENSGQWQTADLVERFHPAEPPRAVSSTPAPAIAASPSSRPSEPDRAPEFVPSDKQLQKLDKKLLEAMKSGKDDRKPDMNGDKDRDKERKPEKEMKRIEKEFRISE